MAKICPVHDVAYQEGGTCWCCEQAKKQNANPEQPQSNKATVIPQTGVK